MFAQNNKTTKQTKYFELIKFCLESLRTIILHSLRTNDVTSLALLC